MGDLLNYFEVAEVNLEELQAKHPEISKEVLEAVCLAWQWGKKKVKSKESNRKKYCAAKEKYYYGVAEQKSSGVFDEIKDQIIKELDEIVQSSSIVECINSIVRLWKTEFQKLADEIGMIINVCHFPPGTSKWNKIEHRMFCYITKNWRGRPGETSDQQRNICQPYRKYQNKKRIEN